MFDYIVNAVKSAFNWLKSLFSVKVIAKTINFVCKFFVCFDSKFMNSSFICDTAFTSAIAIFVFSYMLSITVVNWPLFLLFCFIWIMNVIFWKVVSYSLVNAFTSDAVYVEA